MSLIGKILTGKAVSKAVGAMERRSAAKDAAAASAGEYIPAGASGTGIASRMGNNAMVRGASDFYAKNPKLVASLGVVGALAALAALKRRSF